MQQDALGGRYRRIRLLGRGAMGEVWLAEDTLLHRNVALKTVASYGPPDPEDLNRMMREARLAARLNHPNAVAIYDVFVENNHPCVVMEYVAGKTLADHIDDSGGLPAADVGRIGAAVADALADAHQLGIVHRDVKPANILITERGVPKLADFGIARGTDMTATATGLAIGTPAYLAPELARGAFSDARSDIWALGITLYAALDGRSPFARPGDDVLAVIGRLATAPNVSPPQRGQTLSRTVVSMLAVDPAQRPPAHVAAQMLRADVAALAEAQRPSTESTMPIPPPSPARRNGSALVAVAVLLAGAGAVAIWLLTRSGTHSTAGAPASHSAPTSHTAPVSTSLANTSLSPSPKHYDGVAYSAPGGITVIAPAGWHEDGSAGISNIRDYVAPGQTRTTGTYFRIGIGNPTPKRRITAEAAGAIEFLKSSQDPYADVQVTDVSYVDYQHTQSATIQYSGTNPEGSRRRVVERLWIADGVTRVIELNAAAAQWNEYRPLFAKLLGSATVAS